MWVRGRARARQSSDRGGWKEDEKNGREEPDRAGLNPPTGQKPPRKTRGHLGLCSWLPPLGRFDLTRVKKGPTERAGVAETCE